MEGPTLLKTSVRTRAGIGSSGYEDGFKSEASFLYVVEGDRINAGKGNSVHW